MGLAASQGRASRREGAPDAIVASQGGPQQLQRRPRAADNIGIRILQRIAVLAEEGRHIRPLGTTIAPRRAPDMTRVI